MRRGFISPYCAAPPWVSPRMTNPVSAREEEEQRLEPAEEGGHARGPAFGAPPPLTMSCRQEPRARRGGDALGED